MWRTFRQMEERGASCVGVVFKTAWHIPTSLYGQHPTSYVSGSAVYAGPATEGSPTVFGFFDTIPVAYQLTFVIHQNDFYRELYAVFRGMGHGEGDSVPFYVGQSVRVDDGQCSDGAGGVQLECRQRTIAGDVRADPLWIGEFTGVNRPYCPSGTCL